jgi:hypothetical protein
VKHYLLLIVLLIVNTVTSQQNSIKTTFSDNGTIHKSIDYNSEVLGNFKNKENCTVLGYLGDNFYMVSYNDVVGFVGDEFLTVNNEMMALFYEFQGETPEANTSTKSQGTKSNASSKLESSINAKERALEEKYKKLKEKLEAKRAKEATL